MHYNAAIQIVFSEALDYWMTQLLNKFGKTDGRQSVFSVYGIHLSYVYKSRLELH